MNNEFDQHKGANNAIIGSILTVLTGAVIFGGKKVKEKLDEKREEVILETDNYKFSRKK